MTDPRGKEQVWTTRKLLTWTTGYLERKGLDSPRLSAEMLLAHVLEVERIRLYTDMDRPTGPLERDAFRDLVERAAKHEPVQYLVGIAHFFSMTFKVDRHVLIPRPSTETLVEHVIQHARCTPGFHTPVVADIGTGSGCIAVALAKHIPGCRVIATDVSTDALRLAAENAEQNGVSDRIEFRGGSLYDAAPERFHYVCSNPPYISDDEWAEVAPNVKLYEPTGALRGGADGLDCLRPLIAAAHDHLASPGQLVLEIAASQKSAVLDCVAHNASLTHARVLADAEGFDRILVADGTGI
ncbi:MAG: peptide chain release factor N(5)-glutamine methyltransferase [Phycisphaerales bacterium]